MSKKNLLISLCIISLLIFPRVGTAKMVAMTDDDLCDVVGQAGIAVNVKNLGIDMAMNTLYWGDEDGLDGQTQGGYISLCDVILKGVIDFKNPLAIDVAAQKTQTGTEVSSLNISMSNMTIDIDRFTIDAIRLGPNPGEGASLGSIGIYGMHADITGNIQISAR